MKKVGVAILGLGVVGGGTYKILTEHRDKYIKTHGVDITVESVLELRKDRALALGVEESRIASNISEICSNPEVDIVIEVMGGVEPAKSYVLAALNAGKSVVTSNKELYCKYGYELEQAAKHNHVGLFFEATCVGGVPVIRALLDNLQGNKITSIIGIINGTTNYILTKMTDDGKSYAESQIPYKRSVVQPTPLPTSKAMTPRINSRFYPAFASIKKYPSPISIARA